jgi:hypothetical protein
MTTQTTIDQVSYVTKVVAEIQQLPCVADASTNDYGRFGNFDIHVCPRMNQMANGLYRLLDNKKFPSIMKEIKAVIKKYPQVKMREHYLPDRKNIYDRNIQKGVSGFVRDYISIDLDFMDYDSETNTFK